MAPRYTPSVGDRVAVKRTALATLPRLANLRGTITAIAGGWLATVDWGAGFVSTINAGNLCRPGSRAFHEDMRS